MTKRARGWVIWTTAVVVMLTACGGSDNSDPTTAPTVTATPAATASPAATTYEIGHTTALLPTYDSFTVTFLGTEDSPWAVSGPYVGGDLYTFTALPGMRFVVLTYELTNVGDSPEIAPWLYGDLVTDKEHEWPSWQPPLGILSDEYSPRVSTDAEVAAIPGDATALVDVLPDRKSPVRVIVWEVPVEEVPKQTHVDYVDRPLVLTP